MCLMRVGIVLWNLFISDNRVRNFLQFFKIHRAVVCVRGGGGLRVQSEPERSGAVARGVEQVMKFA